ncbi:MULTISPECIES: triose-phosphate isomerase [Dactylosporangium]|uniref:Triosephosphate isomerase n=2 Tax=Dactylosporangium TaxID=35753 RepID=A0A9W6KHT6_9ACTN|nr:MULTISPECIES: triose-phosphate isomerase [Dactylosporangium]UAB98403.1 triose-phosphate isomerase [Dactylosporangium vinaceum]UWZ46657.1 triose-phosphate isomerase [Dactylosporangium matsuzakiense]GLL01207.1 triosephosphate isomerase [Dactylosporangium matsuzakiense]
MAEVTGRRPLMAGNWKMNLNHLEAIALVQKLAFTLTEQQLNDVEAVVLPPFVDIRSVQTLIDGDKLLIGYGAQDISAHTAGAYTGEISGAMLAKLGCQYVVVGHSERRQYHAEDDTLVNAKVKAALASGIAPILCVGEGLEIRESGEHVGYTLAQLDAALEKVKTDEVEKIVVAYEPVWAIGTGKVATPQDAQEVIGAIRTRLAEKYTGGTADRVRILYGGSVKHDNVAAIIEQPDIDGALVGGASIDAEGFARIVRLGK